MPYRKKKIDQLIKQAIANDPEAANDDKVLFAQVWAQELAEKGVPVSPKQLYGILRRVSNPESITRRRRLLFNMQIISYSKSAESRRFNEFKDHLDEYGGH